ncbi:MAG: hypothetical protein JWN45_3444 [Acidobacteriaceae bacterium]|jgi:hypothetical protein|nr:hypothetical protein [Acidobacteriaceae bacterium]
MAVRVAAKVRASTLALLLAALPVIACTIPGAAMTAAERDCCKRMAEQCGQPGMAGSHGCCQTQVSPSDFHVLKVSSSQLDHSLVDFHAQPVELPTITDSQLIFTANIASPTPSPPGLAYSATSVLRI